MCRNQNQWPASCWNFKAVNVILRSWWMSSARSSGLVTVEDVLVQLVGELEDEFDVAQPAVASLSSGAVVVDGSSNIRDLETQYDIILAPRPRL